CANRPSAEPARVSLRRIRTHRTHTAEAGLSIRAVEAGGGARTDIRKKRMGCGFSRAGTKLDGAHPLVPGQLELKCENPAHVRSARGNLKRRGHFNHEIGFAQMPAVHELRKRGHL